MMTLETLLAPFIQMAIPSVAVSGLAIDSRTVKAGDCFIAYPGTVADGRKFIRQAIANGAVAIIQEQDGLHEYEDYGIPTVNLTGLNELVGEIASHFFGRPTESLRCVGVTGTNGKTSITHFLAMAWTFLDMPAAVLGTIGNGVVGALEATSLTTLDPVSIQALLKRFVDNQIQNVAMEASSHALHQGRLNGIHFSSAHFTNLTHDHLDYHQTMAAYGAAKLKLFERKLNYAVINLDDAFSKHLLETVGRQYPIYTYSMKQADADFVVLASRLEEDGIWLKIRTPIGIIEAKTAILGDFNCYNLLAVVAELCLQEVALDAIVASLAALTAVPGRMHRISSPGRPTVIIDYAHTPDALEQALKAVRHHTRGKLWCIFGCGGDRDKHKRSLMGEKAICYADKVVVCDDNPRGESSDAIIQDIVSGLKDTIKLAIEPKREKAICYAIQQAGEKDTILIAGKGHENYQIYGSQRLVYSDIDFVNQLYK